MDRPSPLAGSRKNRMKGPAPRSGRGHVTAEFNHFVAEVPLRSPIIGGATPIWPVMTHNWRLSVCGRFGLLVGLARRFHQPLDLSLLTLLNRLESDFGTA